MSLYLLDVEPTDDLRSYHVSSEKMRRELGFEPRHTIDILGVLQEKTRGNLTPQEAQLLDQVLYELRLAFVHVSGGQPPRTRPAKRGA